MSYIFYDSVEQEGAIEQSSWVCTVDLPYGAYSGQLLQGLKDVKVHRCSLMLSLESYKNTILSNSLCMFIWLNFPFNDPELVEPR